MIFDSQLGRALTGGEALARGRATFARLGIPLPPRGSDAELTALHLAPRMTTRDAMPARRVKPARDADPIDDPVAAAIEALELLSGRITAVEDSKRKAKATADARPAVDPRVAKANAAIAERERLGRVGEAMNRRAREFWRTGDATGAPSIMERHVESSTSGAASLDTPEGRAKKILADAEAAAGAAMGGQRHLPSGAWTAAAPFDLAKAASDARNAYRRRQDASDRILANWRTRIADHWSSRRAG